MLLVGKRGYVGKRNPTFWEGAAAAAAAASRAKYYLQTNFGRGTAGGTLLGLERDGMAIDFTAAIPHMLIRDRKNTTKFSGNPFDKLTFTRASTAYYYNSSGVLTQAASGAARIDYNPATLAARGLLVEEQRTNRCLRSAEFDNASWVKSNITVTANDAVGPLGTTTADLLTASAGNGTVIQDLGVVASAAKTGSVYIKRKTGTGNIDLTMDNGTTWTTKTITSTWTRFDITQTLADEDFGIRIVTSGDEIWVEGGQVETASFATSYIPTTTAGVTRAADTVSMATSLFPFSATVGTLVANAMLISSTATGFKGIVGISNGNNLERIQLDESNGAGQARMAMVDGGAVQVANDLGAISALTAFKAAMAWAVNDVAGVLNGGTPQTDAAATLPTVDQMWIGNSYNGASEPLRGGWIRQVTYIPRRATNIELQTRTI